MKKYIHTFLTIILGIFFIYKGIDKMPIKLKDISKETGGQFFRATDKEALSQIYARIDELERSEIEVRNFTDYKELFRWFLVPALFLALIYFVLK